MKIYLPTKFFCMYFEVSNLEKIYSVSNQSDNYKFKLRRDIQIVSIQNDFAFDTMFTWIIECFGLMMHQIPSTIKYLKNY